VGDAEPRKSPQKAARKILLRLTMPPDGVNEDWELLALAVRYHRGAEPAPRTVLFHGFVRRQNNVARLAGFLRVARALRKCGVATGAGFRVENPWTP